jgi:hypothetical protein
MHVCTVLPKSGPVLAPATHNAASFLIHSRMWSLAFRYLKVVFTTMRCGRNLSHESRKEVGKRSLSLHEEEILIIKSTCICLVHVYRRIGQNVTMPALMRRQLLYTVHAVTLRLLPAHAHTHKRAVNQIDSKNWGISAGDSPLGPNGYSV